MKKCISILLNYLFSGERNGLKGVASLGVVTMRKYQITGETFHVLCLAIVGVKANTKKRTRTGAGGRWGQKTDGAVSAYVIRY